MIPPQRAACGDRVTRMAQTAIRVSSHNVIDHPLRVFGDAKGDRRAEQAVPQSLRIWLE
jgi:hypothetical protein